MAQAMQNKTLPNKRIYDKIVITSLKTIEKENQILELPTQIFSPQRILIMSALRKFGEVDFKTLKEDIHAKTDGTLASHLRILERLELITYNKEFLGKKPRTSYKLTEEGKELLEKFAEVIRMSINDVD